MPKLTRAIYKTDLGAQNLAQKVRENDSNVALAASRLVALNPHQWAVFIQFRNGTGGWAAKGGHGVCPLHEYAP